MNKAFPLIVWIIALGIFLYTLPEFAAYFGFQPSNKSQPAVYDIEIDGRDISSSFGVTLDAIVVKNPIKFILPDGNGRIYLAAAGKLYQTSNQGKDWQLLLDVPGRQISSLSLAANGKIIVGTGVE